MSRAFSFLSVACAVFAGANASVLGIFEDTNLPAGHSSECGGVHRLEVVNGELYAATETGIYKYSEPADSWGLWALENVNVLDFKANGDEVAAVIAPEDLKGFRAVEMAKLIRFNRNQPEWEDITDAGMGYSYKGQSLTYVMRLAQHPAKPETLMVAAYPGVWISTDFGTTWTFKLENLFSYNENQFLGWHPAIEDVLFYTSENPMCEAQILRSENGGNDWDTINPNPIGENSCHHLAFDPDNSDHILYSGEGSIFESTDCGKTWQCAYREESLKDETEIGYAYNVMFDPANANVAYCVGACNVNQHINIFRSTDKGKNWTRIAQSDTFTNFEYWPHESTLFNGRIYIYTHNGVLAYKLDNSGTGNIVDDITDEDQTLYDLTGRKVSNPQQGTIYIQRGNKIIEK